MWDKLSAVSCRVEHITCRIFISLVKKGKYIVNFGKEQDTIILIAFKYLFTLQQADILYGKKWLVAFNFHPHSITLFAISLAAFGAYLFLYPEFRVHANQKSVGKTIFFFLNGSIEILNIKRGQPNPHVLQSVPSVIVPTLFFIRLKCQGFTMIPV